MPPLPPPEEEDYDSAADSDFDASIPHSSSDESEASGEDAAKKGTKRKKRKINADEDVDMASGDEGIVAQERKKQKKKTGKGKRKGVAAAEEEVEEGDEEGGVGIRVKLRSGRGGEAATTKAYTKTIGVTIDIDSVWARLNAPQAPPSTAPTKPADTTSDTENISPPSEAAAVAPSSSEATVTIPHTYVFAGETHTSAKTVPASSPEAQVYLASKDKTTTSPTGPALRRPLARKGLLDPNPTLTIKGRPLLPRADLPSSIGGQGTRSLSSNAKASLWEIGKGKDKARKLNTVEKSKMDWETEVERQGMREELEKAEKSGGSYLGRMEFLGRGDAMRVEEARLHRLQEMGMQA